MARSSWLDDSGELPDFEEHARDLETFGDAIADGIVEAHEVERQAEALRKALVAAESALDDEQHAIVTRLLVELSAYDMLRFLHELHESRKQVVAKLEL